MEKAIPQHLSGKTIPPTSEGKKQFPRNFERQQPLRKLIFQQRLGNTPFERQSRYRTLWHEGLGSDQLAQIRQHVHSGWPLGGEAFLTTLARSGGRRVAPLPKGRPPRKTAEVGAEDAAPVE